MTEQDYVAAVCCVELEVMNQLKASNITQDPFRLDGEKIMAAAIPKGYVLVPQSLLNRIVEICEEQANEWDSDAVVTHKNYAQCCGVLIRSLIKAAQEPT